MRRIIVAVALVVALTAPAAAQAHGDANQPHKNARMVRLTRVNRQLRARLAHLNAANDKLNSELRADTSQNEALRTELTQRTAERDAALDKIAALDAQFAAIPQPIAVAVTQVQHEVSWARQEETLLQSPLISAGELASVSAMDYVVGHVSTGEYGYLELNSLPLPASTPNDVLAAQAGICGHAALTFAAIMKRLGYDVRSVQFSYTTPTSVPDSHIAVEVSYDGSWHFFDPTFGVFWTDTAGNVLSIADIRADGGTEHKNDVSFTNLVEDPWYGGDDTAFETDPSTTVVLDQQAFVG